MAGVSVLPAQSALSPTFGRPFHAPMQNGSLRSSTEEQTVPEIKEWAQHDARALCRGASAMSLLKATRTQLARARDAESTGELKNALSMYYKAASLMQMYMETAEFKQERGKKGVLTREFLEFQQYDGYNIQQRTKDLENRVTEMESANSVNGVSSDGPVQKSGGSIADRMRSLQNAGLAVNTTSKRISRELPKAPTSPPAPMSPKTARSIQGLSIQTLAPSASQQSTTPSPLILSGLSSPVQPSNIGSPVISSSALYNPSQAFVAPSTLGPPSPTSSSSSSPRLAQYNIDSFQQQFPSIDELDELQGLQIGPAPNGTGSSSSSGKLEEGLPVLPNGIAPKPFSVLPMDAGLQRISSASGLANLDTLISRPSSPARMSPTLRASPMVPRKPSGLGLNQESPLPGRSPRLGNNSPQLNKPDLPVSNTVPPRMLHEYMQHPGINVLLLDLRPRDEYEQEHIKGDAVVCLEPMVLRRESVTGEMIEDSLALAPRNERLLFENRDKFDLVVMYDADSESYGGPFMALERAIYENAFRKMLKKMPVLLVGGLQAWKQEFGKEGVVRGDKAEGSSLVLAHSSNGVNGAGIVNGVAAVPDYQHPPAHSRAPAQSDPHSVIMGRSRSNTESQTVIKSPVPKHQYRQSVDQQALAGPSVLHRRPALSRPPSVQLQRPMIPENTPPIPSAVPSSIQYPTFRPRSPSVSAPSSRPRSPSVSASSSPFNASRDHFGLVSPPPQASINPSPLSRRRSDYIDQSQEALSGSGVNRAPIDYPDLSAHHVLRPPPAVAASSLAKRQDARPQRVMPPPTPAAMPGGPRAPTIPSDYPVTYWGEAQLSPSGLKNMGNTCYMNSTIQCLNATIPFARFFLEGRWHHAVNMVNPLGTKGAIASGFATLLRDLNQGAVSYLTPLAFRSTFITHASQFDGTDQQDCQEFLSTLLDSLHEDLNRILNKPTYTPSPEREAELERLPQPIASEQEWHVYRMRNDSLVVDFFQGQYRSRLECMTCHKTSTTYNAFMYLTLPIPTGRLTKVTIQQCLDTFVKEEIMEKSDAWHCPHCKALRRATKQLTLSRLPPILLIHLKRFSSKGSSTDKIETFVDFPLKGLDLTNYMPPPLPPGVDNGITGVQQLPLDDPRRQDPPYKYDLYAVTNHFGSLSSGHYTAHVASRGQWLYCDDSRVVQADAKDVVAKPAYVLFYKRVKAQ